MKPSTITLYVQGNLRYQVDLEYLRNWKSKLFQVVDIKKVNALPNSTTIPSGYSDQELVSIFPTSDSSDLTFAIVGAALEKNFYARVPAENLVILSMYEMGEILDRENFTAEDFIIRCLYALVLSFIECGRHLSFQNALKLHHDETRGCFYDFNQDKVEIVRSLEKPVLCADCLARLGHSPIDSNFVAKLLQETKRIRKGRYYRILDWAKKNPILAFLLATLWAVVLNLIASAAYDSIKVFLVHSGNSPISAPCTQSSDAVGSYPLH